LLLWLSSMHCHLWPVCLYNIFPHYLINSVIFGKHVLNIQCVFWFSLQLLSETFIPGIIQPEVIGLHVKYPLLMPDFNKTWIFVTDFQKILKCQIWWKSSQWEQSCSTLAGRQSYMTILVGTSCNFQMYLKSFMNCIHLHVWLVTQQNVAHKNENNDMLQV
jgi:competence transcription factor ComK